jgi:hypothetical protein
VSVKRKPATARPKGWRKRRSRPPWGGILGGKPIERFAWNFGEKIDLGEWPEIQQFEMMLRLKKFYGIAGPTPSYPIAGVQNADWLPWYKLALCIASDLDDSLKIIEPRPRGKTTRRWRGLEGRIFLGFVNTHRAAFPHRPVRWCIEQLRRMPAYRQMSLKELVVRYYEAKRHHDATKRAHNRKATS